MRHTFTMDSRYLRLCFAILCVAFLLVLADGKKSKACQKPKKVGPCKAAKPRYYFDKDSGKCKEFIWGGCQPNGNNFATMKSCMKRCGCYAPVKIGDCKAAFPRWYHDKGKCKKFTYGGCKGNANRFKTSARCKAMCK